MTRPWLNDQVSDNGLTVKENFSNWSKNNQLVQDDGMPMVFFRGQRKSPLDTGFMTTNGRAVPSFSPDIQVANVYARQLETRSYGPGSTVVPVYMVMRNPLDLTGFGEQVTLDDLVMQLPNVDLSQDTIKNGVGYCDLAQAIRGFDSVAYKANAHFEIDAGDGEGYRIRDFAELADRIEDLGFEEKIESLSNLMMDVTFDTYLVADSKNMTKLIKGLGFDGVIHLDVFDEGVKYYDGEKEQLDSGFTSDAVITTYRPYYQSQVKSAIGNSGLYSNTPSLTDKDQALTLKSANDAKFAIETMTHIEPVKVKP